MALFEMLRLRFGDLEVAFTSLEFEKFLCFAGLGDSDERLLSLILDF